MLAAAVTVAEPFFLQPVRCAEFFSHEPRIGFANEWLTLKRNVLASSLELISLRPAERVEHQFHATGDAQFVEDANQVVSAL